MRHYPIVPVLNLEVGKGRCELEGYLSEDEAQALERLRALRAELRGARAMEEKLEGLLSAQPSRERVHTLAARVREEGAAWRLRMLEAQQAKLVLLGHRGGAA